MELQNKALYKPGIITGAIVGALLTAAFVAIQYLAWKSIGLAFVPFDVFDWLGMKLPGYVIEFVIRTVVNIIRTLHLGPTSVVAKQIEQGIAIFNLMITGIIGGAIIFPILNVFGVKYAYKLGLLFAVAVCVPALAISLTTGRTTMVIPIVNALWIIIVFLGWGFTFGWTYHKLFALNGPAVTANDENIIDELAWAARIDRRKFLIGLAGSTAVITVVGAGVGMRLARKLGGEMMNENTRWSATHPLPNADAAVKPAPGTRPEFTSLEDHYRIDINTFPPMIDESKWNLKISGLVEKPLSLTLNDLRQYEPLDQFITLSCISNPVGGDLIGTTRWTGVSLQNLLDNWRIKPEATHLKIRSADDFYEVVSLEAIRSDPRIMLTYEWDGVPLMVKHGFPLRIYIPDLHGMKQPKWIESIEAIDHWEAGYWVERGWDKTARMKATSVIDTVAVKSLTKSGGQTLVPIGGIAHAGARGISKVELQVDDDPWMESELRTPLSGLTWVIWRYDWPFQPGRHTFTVRCYDGKGVMQIMEPAPPDPSGASGLFSEVEKI